MSRESHRAQIEALRAAADPEGRYRARRMRVLDLYDLGYNAWLDRHVESPGKF